ncbi:MAG: hypothetical protein K2W95_07095 [Candidatus Obscuribacterales bacterium]|nr:hypothetical protein [Candidatus Obscuribacterales bacterium]
MRKKTRVSMFVLSIAAILLNSCFSATLAAATNGQMQEMAQSLREYTVGEVARPLICERLIKLDLSPEWWSRMTATDQRGIQSLGYITQDLVSYGKKMGYGDVMYFENSGMGDKAEWTSKIESMLDSWQGKVTLTIRPDAPKCDSSNFELAITYLNMISSTLAREDVIPSTGVCHIVYVPSTTAKAFSFAASPDGHTYTITAPISHQPPDSDDIILQGFRRTIARKS